MRFWCNDAEKDDLPIELPVLEQAPERARADHDLLHRTIETVYALSPLGLVAPEAAATEAFPFIEHFWCGIPKPAEGKAHLSLRITPHLGNRAGHAHGGLLLGTAARVANAALPGNMRLSNISAWFVSPGLGPLLKVHSSVVQQGRNLAVVRTQILGASGKLVLEATSQHAAAAA